MKKFVVNLGCLLGLGHIRIYSHIRHILCKILGMPGANVYETPWLNALASHCPTHNSVSVLIFIMDVHRYTETRWTLEAASSLCTPPNISGQIMSPRWHDRAWRSGPTRLKIVAAGDKVNANLRSPVYKRWWFPTLGNMVWKIWKISRHQENWGWGRERAVA